MNTDLVSVYLERIAKALERQADFMEMELHRRNQFTDNQVKHDEEYRDAIIRASKAQELIAQQNTEHMKRRQEWERVEEEHMKVCERQHQQRRHHTPDDQRIN